MSISYDDLVAKFATAIDYTPMSDGDPLGVALVHNLRSGGSGGPPGGFRRRAFERRACRERSCG